MTEKRISPRRMGEIMIKYDKYPPSGAQKNYEFYYIFEGVPNNTILGSFHNPSDKLKKADGAYGEMIAAFDQIGQPIPLPKSSQEQAQENLQKLMARFNVDG